MANGGGNNVLVYPGLPGGGFGPEANDGKGFSAVASRGEGLGLIGMKERVGLLGGRLAIESTEGAGTTIVAEVPLA